MKRFLALFAVVFISQNVLYSENMLLLFKKPIVTKKQLASCFENPVIEETSISSSGEGYEVSIITIAFIEDEFIQGWILFSPELETEDSKKRVLNQHTKTAFERLIALSGFRYLKTVDDDSPESIGDDVDVWMNNYWQFAIRVTTSNVEVVATPLAVWSESLTKLEKAISR